jgi:two-component system NtrC family sensor kinase
VAQRSNKLVHSQKMASFGTLTAGIAHEFNNPTNFIHVSAQNLTSDLSVCQQFIVDLAGEQADEDILLSLKQYFQPLYEHLDTIKEGTDRIMSIVNACDAIEDKQRQQCSKIRGKVVIGCQQVKNTIEITIKDNGCGMSDETKSKLFEPFYTTKEVGEGTGLGLSISYGIVQRHHGELTAESTLGVGSEFTLVLPIE